MATFAPQMMKKILVWFLLVMGLPLLSWGALTAPSLRCVSVNPNGSIQLSWDLPNGNQNEFINYTIYSSSTQAGPYLPLDSVLNFNTQTYLDGSSVGTIYFFLRTKYDDGNGVTLSASSDTLNNMVINLTSPTGNNFPPQLSWNTIRSPLPPSASGVYRIYRKVRASGTWTLIDSTTSLNYVDNSIVLCSDTLYYRIEMDDDLPCTNVSRVANKLFEERTPPNIPSLTYVSVDTTTNGVDLFWNPSSSGDTEGYIIFYNDGGNFIRDTIPGADSLSFSKIDVDASTGPLTFTIAAFDTCGNVSSNGPNHTTAFLSVDENLCDREMILSWTPYEGMNISAYDVFVSIDGGSLQQIGTVPGNENSFVHGGLSNTSEYCYVLAARSANRVSISNRVCMEFTQFNLPRYHYLYYVSVLNEQAVEAEIITDTSQNVKEYRLERSINRSGPYVTVDIIPYEEVPDTFMSFVDSTALPQQSAYYYKVIGIDSCNQPLVTSNVSRTIHLSVEDEQQAYLHKLYWNKYQGWDSLGFGVNRYRVYQGFDREFTLPIDSVIGAENRFDNPYFETRNEGGTFCYYIEATETPVNLFNVASVSRSNEVCIKKVPKIYIPNVFSPNKDGFNDVFLPEIQFVDAGNYELTIYDRWGNLIVTLTDPAVGWDGMIGTTQAPIGTYAYSLTLTTPRGGRVEKRGAVSLIR